LLRDIESLAMTGVIYVKRCSLLGQGPSYFVSLWTVCFLQNLQYFLSSSLSVVVFLFLVVV
jgi:hypothetical protein